MSEYVFLFRTSEEGRREAMATPERAQQSLKAWRAWTQSLEASGHMKERGQPLDHTGKVVRGSRKVVTDGPYAEAKDMVLGFIVVAAKDMAEAVELAGDCPMVLSGGAVEIRPVIALPV